MFFLFESFRLAAWGLLFIQLGLYLHGLVVWVALGGAVLIVLTVSLLPAVRKLRLIPFSVVLGLLLVLLHRGGVLLISLLGWEELIFNYDGTFLIFAVPLFFWGFSSYLGYHSSGWRQGEPLLLGAFWALFLFPQGQYEMFLYPHPFYLAAFSFIFVLLCLGVLFLSRRQRFPSAEISPSGGASSGHRRFWTLLFLLLLLPFLAAVFLYTLGRYGEGAVQSGGGLVKPTMFRFDFSEFLELESEISMKEDLVLLYHQDEPLEDDLYLRRFVLSGYSSKKGFFREDRVEEQGGMTEVPHQRVSLPDPGYKLRYPLYQEYYLVNFDPQAFLAADYPVEVIPFTTWDNASFLRIYGVNSMVAYSRAGALSYQGREDSLLSDPEWEAMTTYGEEDRIRALALEVTEDAETPYAKALALERYFQEEFLYSLRPGVSPQGNQLHYFLFDTQRGYCTYFAFAMALMCRSLDIPARVAVGFWVDPSTGVLDYYPVQSNQAHAWVEVYFGNAGWLTFDPTSQNLAPGEEYDFSLGGDPEEIKSLLEEILGREGALQEEKGTGLRVDETGGLPELIQRVWRRVRRSLLIMVIPLLYLLHQGLPWLILLCRGRLGKSQKRRLRAHFSRSVLLMTRAGVPRRRGEAWGEYVRRWGEFSEEAQGLLWQYLAAEYGPPTGEDPLSREEERVFRRRTGELTASLFRQAACRRRLAMIFSLRGGRL